ncbi:hypothetical protein [Alteromonas oceanisediminis]|uniref:hypothetical protein n=1 Tax=Alteromonas oceanisediminis TaxID=2836180 RepID=UPI001BD914FF|nr:hypothetical protein [Alteromonas oceanisediminis]MBT0586492.1 hypothetical protein [Alteromonas oceanisediminis]
MKYYVTLPLTALLALAMMQFLVLYEIIPPGTQILEHLQSQLNTYFYALTGLLNLPYYLLLIAATAFASEEIMQVAENPTLVFSLLSIWLFVACILDWRKHFRSVASD